MYSQTWIRMYPEHPKKLVSLNKIPIRSEHRWELMPDFHPSIHPSPWCCFGHLFLASAPDGLLPLKPRGPRMLFNNTATLPKTPIDLVPNCKTSLISSLCLRTSQDSSHQRGAGIGWTELQYVELMLDISYMDNYGYIMIYLISYIWICWILWILSIGINVWIYL